MKKIITLILLLASLVSYSQAHISRTKMGLTMGYGTNNNIIMGIDMVNSKNLILGMGGSIPLDQGKMIGADYSNSSEGLPFSWHERIGSVSEDSYSIHMKVGHIIGKDENFRICGRVGFISNSTYDNYYSYTGSIGNNGYYYIETNTRFRTLLGVSAGFNITKKLSIDLGLDNFNGKFLEIVIFFI
jgi:hypothetical protein